MPLNQSLNNSNSANYSFSDLKTIPHSRSKRGLQRDVLCTALEITVSAVDFLPMPLRKPWKKFAIGAFGLIAATYTELESCSEIALEELGESQAREFSEVRTLLGEQTKVLNHIELKLGEMSEEVSIGFKTLNSKIEKLSEMLINYLGRSGENRLMSELIFSIERYSKELGVLENIKKQNGLDFINKWQRRFIWTNHLSPSLNKELGERIRLMDEVYKNLFMLIERGDYFIPKDINDNVAEKNLGILMLGVLAYSYEFIFLRSNYILLTIFYYERNDVENGNKYFLKAQSAYDIKNKNFNLINNLVTLLDKIQALHFVKYKAEKANFKKFLEQSKESMRSIKHYMEDKAGLIFDKTSEFIEYDFSSSSIRTPLGNKWKKRAKVSYAIQYKDQGVYSQVNQWSIPYEVVGKACPLLNIGIDSEGKTRRIFRMFNNQKAELVGIVEDGNQTHFRDINKDLYHAALNANQEIAQSELARLLQAGANVFAVFEDGRQVIHAAAIAQNSHIIRTLMERGADINAVDKNEGYAPIHIAAKFGYERFINDLISFGSDVNAGTAKRNQTALHIAASKGYVSTVINLMQTKGVNINAKEKENGYTPLHMAIYHNKSAVVSLLLQDSRIDINATSLQGYTALHIAITRGDIKTVEAVLSQNIDVNFKSHLGMTALDFAMIVEKENVVKTLLKSKDVEPFSLERNSAYYPLFIPILKGNLNIFKLVIEEASEKKKYNTKKFIQRNMFAIHLVKSLGMPPMLLSALELAVMLGKLNIVNYLLENDASMLWGKVYYSLPVLHGAIISGNFEIIKALVRREADINSRDFQSNTPLMSAIGFGFDHAIEYFLKLNGTNLTARNTHGQNALHLAVVENNFNAIKLLREKGLNVNQGDKEHSTSLYYAAQFAPLDQLQYLIEQGGDITQKNSMYRTIMFAAVTSGELNKISYLHEKQNMILTGKDNKGNSLMFGAAYSGSLPVIEYLYKNGLNVTISNRQGEFPLHAAILGRASLKSIQYFSSKTPNFLRIKINEGVSLLHYAAQYADSLEVLQYFIDKGASVVEKDDNGNTLLHYAARSKNKATVSYVLNLQDEEDNRAAYINEKNKQGMMAAHYAVQCGSLEIFQYLIEEVMRKVKVKVKVEVEDILNVKDNNENTMLHYATLSKNQAMVAYVLKNLKDKKGKIEYINEKNKQGLTAAHYAANSTSLGILEYLKEEGADFNKKDNNGNIVLHYLALSKNPSYKVQMLILGVDSGNTVSNNDGNTPLHLAASTNNLGLVEYFSNSSRYRVDPRVGNREGNLPLHLAALEGALDVVNYFVDTIRIHFNSRNSKGNSVLHLAALGNALNVVKYLIDEKLETFNIVNRKGDTPLHLAASKGALEVLKYLIDEKQADVEDKNNNDDTLLHLAVKGSRLDAVKYFVAEKHLDFNDKNMQGETPLHVAAKAGKLETVQYLGCQKQIAVNVKNNEGDTPLHLAVSEGALDIVKYLIDEKQANVNIKNNLGDVPLHLAALVNALGIVKYLVDEKQVDANVKNNEGNTPLLLAAAVNAIDVVKYLVDEKQADVNVKNKWGNSPLHVAAYFGFLDLIKYFVDEKQADVNIKNKASNTPLHIAASRGHLDVVKYFSDRKTRRSQDDITFFDRAKKFSEKKYLIDEKQADVNGKNNEGDTPLHLAASIGAIDVVKYLIDEKQADVNVKNNDDETVLHVAAREGHLGLVKYLIDEKQVSYNAKNTIGATPLHLAARWGMLDVVKYLIDEKQADVNVKNNDGNTPLHLAVSMNKLEVIQYLVDQKPDINIKNNKGNTPLHVAAAEGRLEIVRYFCSEDGVRFSGDPERIDINAKNNEGATPLHVAARWGILDVVKYFVDEKQVDINDKDRWGDTSLHIAAKGGRLDVVKYLVDEKQADVNDKDMWGETPLHVAAREGKLEVVRYLGSQKQIAVNAKNKWGNTPLHVAAKENKLEIVTYLVDEKNANVNAVDNWGNTPLKISKYQRVISFLQSKGGRARRSIEPEFLSKEISASHTIISSPKNLVVSHITPAIPTLYGRVENKNGSFSCYATMDKSEGYVVIKWLCHLFGKRSFVNELNKVERIGQQQEPISLVDEIEMKLKRSAAVFSQKKPFISSKLNSSFLRNPRSAEVSDKWLFFKAPADQSSYAGNEAVIQKNVSAIGNA